MKEVKIEKCPFCGGTNFGIGYQMAQGSILTEKSGIKGSKVKHLICKECGIIVQSKVENPEIFTLDNDN